MQAVFDTVTEEASYSVRFGTGLSVATATNPSSTSVGGSARSSAESRASGRYTFLFGFELYDSRVRRHRFLLFVPPGEEVLQSVALGGDGADVKLELLRGQTDFRHPRLPQ